jgi:hypothetical protein
LKAKERLSRAKSSAGLDSHLVIGGTIGSEDARGRVAEAALAREGAIPGYDGGAGQGDDDVGEEERRKEWRGQEAKREDSHGDEHNGKGVTWT